MKEVIEFLNSNPVGCLGTVDNGKPRVRPFQFMFEQEGKLYFCTANTKDVYRQLQKNPFVEFSSTSKDFVTVRVSGEVKFGKDLEIKRRIIDSNDLVKSIYQTPDNPAFEIFYLEKGKVIMFDFSGQPPKIFEF